MRPFFQLIMRVTIFGAVTFNLAPLASLTPLIGLTSLHAQTLNHTELKGEIKHVTLYKDAALVSREINLSTLPQGMSEVTIVNLPPTTDRASVYADQAEGLTVRSVAFQSSRPDVQGEIKSKVETLDAEIKTLEHTIASKRNEIALKRKRQEFINDLKLFTPNRARAELKHGILKASDLGGLIELMMTQYEDASKTILRLDFEIDDHAGRLATLRRERANLAQPPTMRYDAVILLERTSKSAGRLRLNYLVKDCGWSPVYNVRGVSGEGETEVEFNALIHQVSGEDWNLVNLKLSTASPKTSAYNPLLTPLHVQVSAHANMIAQQQVSSGHFNQSNMLYNTALVNRQRAITGQLRSSSFNDMVNANFDANSFAADLQVFELSQRVGATQTVQDQTQQSDLSIQYIMRDSLTLYSRREGQTINVFRQAIPASYYHIATPVLTSSVFREAELINATNQDLLSGKVSVYLDGRFVGMTSISTIPRGQKFNVGFGVDGQLRAHRTLLDRAESVQGGNQRVELSIEISIDHYAQEPLRLLVRDRIPYIEDQSKLRVNILELSHPLSERASYTRFMRPKNLLLWDFEVAPGHGDRATLIQYDYMIEFDKNQEVSGIKNDKKNQLRDEFLLKSKQRKVKRSRRRSRRKIKHLKK